jgi:hypothetical protein
MTLAGALTRRRNRKGPLPEKKQRPKIRYRRRPEDSQP